MDVARLVTTHHGLDTTSTFKFRAAPRHEELSGRTYKSVLENNASSYWDSSLSKSYMRYPQRPPSPPAEAERKFSLPSISSLLQGADSSLYHAAKRQRIDSSPPKEWELRRSLSQGHESLAVNLPPTPPLGPNSGHHSSGQSPTPPTKPADKCQLPPPPNKVTLPSLTDPSFIATIQISTSKSSSASHLSRPPYLSPVSCVSSSFSSPVEPSPSSTTSYHHRQSVSSVGSFSGPDSVSSPASYPPPQVAVAPLPHRQSQSPPAYHQPSQTTPLTPPTWQHHHYFPHSSATPFQQNQDRYICRTCHKAFSRPSSLRIHSHSHTGEKPFRCTQPGCGKAFSVRSNMKRHERGCHTARPVAATVVGS